MRHFHPILLFVATILLLSCPAPSSADEGTPSSIRLFNGQDLTGWTTYLWDRANKAEDVSTSPEDVWSVEDGILICRGRPSGYLLTKKSDFQNYKLSLQWRWAPGTKGGNNGVLVHCTTPNALGCWPKSIEVQLKKDDAGDFWVIGTQIQVENPDGRVQGRRHLNLTDGSEKPLGQWNTMEIVCRGDEVTVWVNGERVNHATQCSQQQGAIALQSEGAPIHYRKLILTPLK